MNGQSLIFIGFLASLLAGLTSGISAFPVLFLRNISQGFQDIMMGFGSGVMLFVVSDEIILESHRKGLRRKRHSV